MDKLETILTLMRLPGVGPARIRRALAVLGESGMPIEEAFSASGRRLLTAGGVSPSAPQAVIGHVAEQLRRESVHCLVAPFGEFALPDSARKNLPPVLFAIGPTRLMAAPSVGFCGSRGATGRGLEVAADIAEQVAGQGFNVVSGGAKGVDITAHRTALASGGTTTVVLAEGILQYRMRQELRAVFDPARTLVVSEFFPDAPWLAGRAMQRNRTICALSRAMVLIEARRTGGTFAAGEAALAMGVPLFTADYSTKLESSIGNRILLDRGAIALRQSRATGRANLTRLLATARGQDAGKQDGVGGSAVGQQELFAR